MSTKSKRSFIQSLLNPCISLAPTGQKQEVPGQNYILCNESSPLEICYLLVSLLFYSSLPNENQAILFYLLFSSDFHNNLQICYIIRLFGLFQAKVVLSSILVLPVPSSILLHWEQNKVREHISTFVNCPLPPPNGS